MRKHLLRIALFYTLFELLRQVGESVALWVRGKFPFVWVHNVGDRIMAIGGFFIFLLYPLTAFAIFETCFRQRKRLALTYWAGCILVIISIRYLVEQVFYLAVWDFTNYSRGVSLLYYFLDNIYYAVLYSSFGIIYFFIHNERELKLNQAKLMLANKQTELSFLRSQVNPHFLFNSLNNIYSLVYHKNDQSLSAIAKLSDLLRYMLYDANEQVPLEKELEYIDKYIDLQQMRFDQPVQVGMAVSGRPEKARVPPLLLIPFVENAFKHGDLRHGIGIQVKTYADEQVVRFGVVNAIGHHQKDAGGGIGLENVRRRLDLLFPGKHRLEIKQTTDIFEVELEINK
ncbi:histidine kinase [Paraflavitalea sp. CAU 1676]|uniref:sensor histidine kinase n=1 Tax=Paraflavitalea sp. CAU 1676 TaxID=3032598 RepID=UPI0023DAE26B|nr:histidine kinase [Paraflavitalea sp. CAU 1676]MDF2190707.1 histidine kinase [Paraflavitalea sp. CAU 1676]